MAEVSLEAKNSVVGKISKLDTLHGKSAFEIAVINGFSGTEAEWLASLKGAKGDKGERGSQGERGLQGDKGDQGEQGLQGEKGDKGDQGEQGIQGEKGDKGDKGDTGNSGVYLGSGAMPEDCNVQIDPDGEALLPKISNFENDSGFITKDDVDSYLIPLIEKVDKNYLNILGLQASTSGMEKQIGELEGICYDLKEVHNYNLTLSCIGSDESTTGYEPEIDTFTVDLKAGKTYKLSIVAPCVGTGILCVHLNSITCTFEYKTDSYDCLLKPESDITTLTIGGIEVDGIGEDVFSYKVNFVIEERTAIDEKLGKVEQMVEMVINELCKPSAKIGYVDLPSNSWVGENKLYSQVVAIEGVTERSQVDLTPSVEQLAIFCEKDLTFVTENEGGIVTVYAIGQKPQNDYTIQVTITETERVSADV